MLFVCDEEQLVLYSLMIRAMCSAALNITAQLKSYLNRFLHDISRHPFNKISSCSL